MSFRYLFGAVMIMAVVTLVLRAFPFLLFGGRKPPELVLYFGRVVSPGAIAMLVVYCFNSVDPLVWPCAVPELLASAAVVILHFKLRNPLLSIIAGTVLYMILVQMVFI
jgi:branched-chain amino acid transport